MSDDDSPATPDQAPTRRCATIPRASPANESLVELRKSVMTHDVAEEVVPSGSLAQVERWSELLRKARILFQLRRCCDEYLPRERNHAGIWVDRYAVARVRSASRDVEKRNPCLGNCDLLRRTVMRRLMIQEEFLDGGSLDSDLHNMSDDGCSHEPDPAWWVHTDWRDNLGEQDTFGGPPGGSGHSEGNPHVPYFSYVDTTSLKPPKSGGMLLLRMLAFGSFSAVAIAVLRGLTS